MHRGRSEASQRTATERLPSRAARARSPDELRSIRFSRYAPAAGSLAVACSRKKVFKLAGQLSRKEFLRYVYARSSAPPGTWRRKAGSIPHAYRHSDLPVTARTQS